MKTRVVPVRITVLFVKGFMGGKTGLSLFCLLGLLYAVGIVLACALGMGISPFGPGLSARLSGCGSARGFASCELPDFS